MAAPWSLRALRGRVVLLDFWTSCCINCLHELPMLDRLGARFGDALAVVGVHSAKFPHERATATVAEAVRRLDVTHPVVNDPRRAIWSHYAVRAWPTFVLIDPEGYVVGAFSGEGHEARLAVAIARLIERAGAGTASPAPLPAIEPLVAPRGALSYPGKVLADEAGDRLYIADSHHHRVVVTTLDGRWLATIGGPTPGAANGAFSDARFRNPQGMALTPGGVLVADTDNHLVRRIDWASRSVETLWGTGRQAPLDATNGSGRDAALNSPWDIAVAGETVYVAMAGSHQIWKGDMSDLAIGPWAGSGAEGLHDGPLPTAALAQPSGLSLGPDGALFVADSEVSGVREIRDETVTTLVGRSLFVYGDHDGAFDAARLQHPLGIAWDEGGVLVADTYNHKIKRLDLIRREVATLAGTGATTGDGALWEPGGLSVTRQAIYIADTNHHRVQVLDRAAGTLETLEIRGMPPDDTGPPAPGLGH